MKIRTQKKLLVILINSLKQGNKEFWFNNGMCGEIQDLWTKDIINYHEQRLLSTLVKENKPTDENQFKSFYENVLFKPEDSWWWDMMSNGIEFRRQRILFLEALKKTL